MTSRTDSFLAGLILAGALLALAVPDYELLVGSERICAKSAAACAEAQEAIRTGRWPIAPKDAPTTCVAHPGCFSERSNCIANYNCR